MQHDSFSLKARAEIEHAPVVNVLHFSSHPLPTLLILGRRYEGVEITHVPGGWGDGRFFLRRGRLIWRGSPKGRHDWVVLRGSVCARLYSWQSLAHVPKQPQKIKHPNILYNIHIIKWKSRAPYYWLVRFTNLSEMVANENWEVRTALPVVRAVKMARG